MKKRYNYFIAAGITLLIIFLIIISVKSCEELKEGENRISKIESGLSEDGIDYSDEIDKKKLEDEIFSDEGADVENNSLDETSDEGNNQDLKDEVEQDTRDKIVEPIKQIEKPAVSNKQTLSYSKRYIVIVGSFRKDDNANLMIEIAKKWGYHSPKKKRMPSGLIAVYVKEFESKKEANTLAKAIRKNRNVETYVTLK